MVDFTQRTAKKKASKPIDPTELYDGLDRASDKGPLRPVQVAVLTEWHKARRDDHDLILKLHTGQGKTLIGLVLLLSKLNEGKGPALYLCPNQYLVDQTVAEAKAFGVPYVTADDGIPPQFNDGQAVLIAVVHKLFNGRTQFGVGLKGEPVGALVMDDCHACIDAIQGQTRITLDDKSAAFKPLLDLFATDLEAQRPGTFAEVRHGQYDAIIQVPYWAWLDRLQEVTEILMKHGKEKPIYFPWPVLKDDLANCQCVVSGQAIEITPYVPPLHLFPSYAKASHRVFMSATVTDDSFLIKGLNVSADAIRNPLVHKDESWSGEKMVLIPSLIDASLDRPTVMGRFTPAYPRKTTYGIAALVPSFKAAGEWGTKGAVVAKSSNIEWLIREMRDGKAEKTVLFANRYDGIDLPDQTCRILIMDSLPTPENLTDRHLEQCRPGSDAITMKTTRVIEQGLGRSVRGEKDYSVIVLIGPDLIRHVQTGATRQHFSDQTRAQIELGLEIAEMAVEEIQAGKKPMEALVGLINQCLRREDGWKNFYVERMDAMARHPQPARMLALFLAEAEAETLARAGKMPQAVATIQKIIDTYAKDDPAERGWYLQEMARHTWAFDRLEAEKLQGAAHSNNPYVLKPRGGAPVPKLDVLVSQKRVERIIAWLQNQRTHQQAMIALDDVLNRLEFGVKADKFEAALDELAEILGFAGQRPDRQHGAGPDNLWQVREQDYVLWECKNEVKLDREQIHKDETGQMNNACGWFDKHYKGATASRVMIIPAQKCAPGAHFTHDVRIMRPKELQKFKGAVRAFFVSMAGDALADLSAKRIQELLDAHKINSEDLVPRFTKTLLV